jgi:hypothetical protein
MTFCSSLQQHLVKAVIPIPQSRDQNDSSRCCEHMGIRYVPADAQALAALHRFR